MKNNIKFLIIGLIIGVIIATSSAMCRIPAMAAAFVGTKIRVYK